MSGQNPADPSVMAEDVYLRAEAWLDRLEAVTKRLEQIADEQETEARRHG